MEHPVVSNKQGAAERPNGLKAAVCHLLDFTELEYAQKQYEIGVEYLRLYIPDDPAGAHQLIRTRSYWGWWRMNWESRDRAFVGQDWQRFDYSIRREVYDDLHNPTFLASAIYPGRLVLELSYSQMIQSLFDTEMHQL